MIKLTKTLEALPPKDWDVHGKTVRKISEHELVSVVITLTANRIHNNEKRPAGRTMREIATALQDISKAEISCSAVAFSLVVLSIGLFSLLWIRLAVNVITTDTSLCLDIFLTF